MIAKAGPDQTVPGPGPVSVLLDGSGSIGDIVEYRWYDELGWEGDSAVNGIGKTILFYVNFGSENSKPGATRTVTLEIKDTDGNTAQTRWL